MLVSVNELFKYDIQATDGQMGQSYDLLCDDRFWTCRFMAVDTHPWLPLSHKVLLSPTSVKEMDSDDRTLHVSLTKDKVKAAPSMDTHEPVSREFERSFFDFYGYGYYWLGPHPWGVHNDPFALADMQKVAQEINDEDARKENKHNHLRSLKEIKRYGIVGADDAKGHAQDFIIDNKNWAINFIVVDTKDWLPNGKKVLMLPSQIAEISWADQALKCHLPIDTIASLPEHIPDLLNDAKYLASLRTTLHAVESTTE